MIYTRGMLLSALLPVLLFACLLSFPAHAHALITFDATSSGSCNDVTCAVGGTQLTFSHKVSAGSNKLLVVGVMVQDNGSPVETVQSVTYGATPQNLTKVGTRVIVNGPNAGDIGIDHWYLVNPPVGTANVVITISAAVSNGWIRSVSTSFFGASQTTPIRGFIGNDAQNNGPATSTISSTVGDVVLDTMCSGAGLPLTPTIIANQSVLWAEGDASNVCNSIAASTSTGATSVTMSWDLANGPDNWVEFVSSIEPFVPAGRIIRLRGGVRLIGGVRLL